MNIKLVVCALGISYSAASFASLSPKQVECLLIVHCAMTEISSQKLNSGCGNFGTRKIFTPKMITYGQEKKNQFSGSPSRNLRRIGSLKQPRK